MTGRRHLPHYTLTLEEKRAVLNLGRFIQIQRATIQLDTPLGFYAGMLVAAHREGILPGPGDTVRFGRTKEFDVPYGPGWMLLVEPRVSPHNARERVWDEPWALERCDHVTGLLKVLDPTIRSSDDVAGADL